MLILGFFLVPMVLTAPTEWLRNTYLVTIEGEVHELKSIEVIGQPHSSDPLDLSGLSIEGIDANAFENVTHVNSITLANNSINEHHLPQSAFSRLEKLEDLSLADNEIRSLGSGRFMGLSNLKFLNISNNPIGPLSQGSFYGLGKSTNISARLTDGLSILHTLVFDHFNDSKQVPNFEKCKADPILFESYVDVCIRNGIVERLDSNYSQIIEPHCKTVYSINNFESNETGFLDLHNLGISKFAAGWYRSLTPFNALNFNDNNITDTTLEFLNDLPAYVKHIDLSNNKIVSLKKEIILNEHIMSLNLTSNSISEIEDGALEKTKLEILDLRKNRLNNTEFIRTLPPTLLSLTLSENGIAELLPDVFTRFHKLDKIDFSDNNITVIKNESLRGLDSVKSLIFARNKIENIEKGSFQHLTSLRYLDLSNNKLTNLKKGVFNGLQLSIQKLYLNNNKIKEIESGTFDSRTLGSLYLQNNSLSQINGHEFAGIDNLTILDLSSNGITKIEKGFAKYLSKVVELFLSYNPIDRLENGALFGITKAENSIVRLNGIRLDLLQGGVFDDL